MRKSEHTVWWKGFASALVSKVYGELYSSLLNKLYCFQ